MRLQRWIFLVVTVMFFINEKMLVADTLNELLNNLNSGNSNTTSVNISSNSTEIVQPPIVEPIKEATSVTPTIPVTSNSIITSSISPVIEQSKNIELPKSTLGSIITPVIPPIIPPVVIAPEETPKIVSSPTIVTAKAQQPENKESEQVQLEVTNVHEITSDGLDTLHINSGGNWLEKRIWYKKAEDLFESIRSSVQKSSDIRMKFIHEVNQIGHQIDEFYKTINFQKGQIDELLQAVIREIAIEQEVRSGDLSSSERDIKVQIQAEQKQFEVLGKDLKLVDDLDEQIDKTMMKSFKEIDSCRALETRAWNNFKEIGLELDDKKARVLYYEMENFGKNIDQKIEYLQSNLLPYLQNQLVNKVNQTMDQIKTTVQGLQSKGLELQSLLQKDEQEDFLILKKMQAEVKAAEQMIQDAHEAVAKASVAEEKRSEQLNSDSFYMRIINKCINYLCIVFCKLIELTMMVGCCLQGLFCKIQEIICQLFGY